MVCIRCAIVNMVDSLNSSRIVLETVHQSQPYCKLISTHSMHQCHLACQLGAALEGAIESLQSIEAVASSMTKTLFLLKIARAILKRSA
jgi:hypothetical protein